MEGRTDEPSTVHGRADRWCPGGARGRGEDADLASKHGVSEATLYNWKAKYGGMDVSEAKRLKQLEDENAKLKKLLSMAPRFSSKRAPENSPVWRVGDQPWA